VTAPKLLNLTDVTMSISDGGEFLAPNAVDFSGSTVTLTPLTTFQPGGLTNLDDARITVAGGRKFGTAWGDVAADTYSSASLTHWGAFRRQTVTLFSADGNGTELDLSSLQSLTAAFDDDDAGGSSVQRIAATNGGKIGLSGLRMLTGPTNDALDRLDLVVSSGGAMDLTGLQTIASGGEGYVRLDLGATTQELPLLTTGDRADFDLDAGATVNAPALTTLTRSRITMADGAALHAPGLTQFSDSTVTLTALRTFETGELTQIDNSRITLAAGAQFGTAGGNVAAGTYSSASLTHFHAYRRQTVTVFSADGTGTELDLSSLQTLNAAFDDNDAGGSSVQRIAVTNGGKIDLSGLRMLTGPTNDALDRLDFVVGTDGEIDLSSLRIIETGGAGRVKFEIGTGGKLVLGDLARTVNTDIHVNDLTSRLEVPGNLYLNPSSGLTAAALAEVKIGDSFVFGQTDEVKLDVDEAFLHMNGSGLQFLEVGSEDLGLGGSASGNFGIGQLIVGQVGQPTTVQLLDVLDNGNRTDGQPEGLYLYGVGGSDGLIIHEGSTLILEHHNVYALIEGEWLHLNSEFGDGITDMPFGDGTMVVPEPATLGLLLAGFLAAHRRRRRHRS
jgi:hypothetical protein